MKVLYVTPTYPDPPRRGYTLMAYNQIRLLSARHTIDLISFASSDGNSQENELAAYCRRIDKVPLSRVRQSGAAAMALGSARPLQVSYFSSSHMRRLVEERLQKESYDVLVFYLTRMAQYLPDRYRGATVLNMVDPYVLNYGRSLSWRPLYQQPLVKLEVGRLRNYESMIAARFSRNLLISEQDVRDYEVEIGARNLDWVPHAVNPDYFSPSPETAREQGMIVLSGSMFYAPNVDAVNYFCGQIFPLIRRRSGQATLWLAGSRPSRRVRKWANNTDIFVTGWVDDLRPYLRRAMVSVCPVRLSVGTQTKLLEAMAVGTPVVTTSAGNHGLSGVPGRDLSVADSPSEYADKVCDLLNGKNWQEYSKNGRSLVLDRFTWKAHVDRFEDILLEVTQSADLAIHNG